MFLKRLELQGFKSFADKTVLSFADGATGVVGPNGSGKSNISDAIRWVIGEMSAKSLRGSNMQDVIFAGTATRKPVNYAEVSLVLDNSSHMFNIDFDEVIVTRRLFRSGESAYQINRANCRLKDIHELFMDTGLGRDGYSIIGQGNVAQILSNKPEDRRSLFEEAAGVSKYKYRKEEAARKLANTEENLIRINDIVYELESQLEPLKKQSEKARKYLELYTEYRELDVSLSLINLDKNKVEQEKADKLYNDVNSEIEGLKAQETEAERRSTELYEKQKSKDEEKTQLHARLIENENSGAAIAKDISIAENDIKNNKSAVQRTESEIAGLKQKSEQHSVSIAEYRHEIEEKNAEAQRIMQNFDTLKADNESSGTRQNELADEIESYKRKVSELRSSAESRRERLKGNENLRNTYLERREIINAELKSFNEGIESTRKEIEDDTCLIAEKQEKLSKLNKLVSAQKRQLEKLNAEIIGITEGFNKKRVDYDTRVSKKRMLEGLENDFAGYARSVRTVLKEQSLKHLSIYGTVSSLVEVNRQYVTAIETVLGGALQNIIVEREEDAKAAIEFLRRSKAGRATFLPVSSVHGRTLENIAQISGCTGFIGAACDLVSYNRKYDGIVKSLLGRVVVVDNIDNAIAMSRRFGYKFRVVTIEGDILNAGGSLSGGSVNKQSGLMSRASEIRELTAEIQVLTNELKALKADRERLDTELKTVNEQLSTYMPVIRGYEDEILRLENTVKHLKTTVENGGSTEENYRTELENIEKQLKDSSDTNTGILMEIRRFENAAAEHEAKLSKLNDEYERVSAEREKQSEDIMNETLKLADLQRDVKSLEEKIISSENEIAEAEKGTKEKQDYCEELEKRSKELKKTIEEKENHRKEIADLSAELKHKIEIIDEQKAGIVESLKGIQSDNKTMTDTLINLQQELSRAETKRVKLNMEYESIMNHLWDEYELTYTAAAEMRKEFDDTKEAFKRSSELKSQIKDLGHVNMESIDEYTEKKERYEFLSTQRDDLEKSKDNLNKIIDSMEELMEEHFGNQFNVISKSFSEVFIELFGGGRGRLSLTDPNNLLESGIEIEVQLPGKGLQNINLYSGGEKSFIAIALLFAILKVKPTPFCILDEIDAALDDVNVSRFATYLRNYTDRTQFIVITHRRGTMEAANILYGVTMQEKGVTKLLSLNIDDVEDSDLE